ncbi:MAG: hypothetical protein E6Q53_01640 [Candidatus Moraniibacteriota bacterium]|nr:MAG: hypothetical protein E6Q53_01640 [Candidatus Moranbacteria bacterium]
MTEINVGDWLHKNQKIIQRALLDERRRIIEMNIPDYNIDDTQLLLSEMELCGATEHIPLPPGYRVTHGLIGFIGNPRPSYHIFAVNEESKIIDVTAGQIMIGESKLQPGDGIRKLVAKAPDLFTILGDVIALHGDQNVIRERLGVKYDWLK